MHLVCICLTTPGAGLPQVLFSGQDGLPLGGNDPWVCHKLTLGQKVTFARHAPSTRHKDLFPSMSDGSSISHLLL